MPTPLTFNWDEFLISANDPDDVVDDSTSEITDEALLTQDTGGIEVGVTYFNDSTIENDGSGEISGSTQFVDTAAGETFNTTSGLRLNGASGGGLDTATVAIDFSAVAGSGFNDEVENVTFRLNDIDASDWRDDITVREYDADGNLINVNITFNGETISGTDANVLGDVAAGNLSQAAAAGSALVEIAGPVASIEIDYNNENTTSPQFLWVTDIHFDAVDAIPLDGTVSGTAGDDVIDESYTGDPEGDMVDNDDAILAGDTGDDDLIFGFEGDDSISAGDGDDEVFGGIGDDTIDGGAGDDTISADAGSDTISVTEDEGTDTITGGEDAGDGDVDTIDFDDAAADGVDVTLTDDEEGTYAFGSGDGDGTFSEIEAFDLTDQDDTFDGSADTTGIAVDAGAGDDVLTGGTGADDLDGEEGDDTFVVNDAFGDDTITGGEAGETDGDVIDGSGLTENVTVDFSGPEAGEITNGTDTATFSEVEAIETGAGDDTINGSDGDDIVAGGSGEDLFDLGAGDDTIDLGTDGADTDGDADTVVLQDGSGSDTITSFDAPTANPDGTFTGIDTLDVTDLNDADGVPVNTNDVTVSDDGEGNAVLTFPNGESVTLVGISPDDADDPQFLNAIGIPLPDGTVSGTSGNDTITDGFVDPSDGDTVDDGDAIIPGHAPNDDLIEAGAGDDTIDGGLGDDTIFAGTGSDTISVSEDEGTDTITGGEEGSGADIDAVDTVDFDDAAADGVDVTLTDDEEGTYAFGSGDGDGTFSEIEAFDLTDQDDTFDGSADTTGIAVDAGAGDDVLTGGTGADDLDGEEGDDTFVVNDAFGDDTITGGEAGETDGDVIDGSGLTENVTVDFSGPEAGEITNGTDTATFSEVEAIETGAGDDTINGSTGDDVVTTNDGDDVLFGGAGDDTLDAGDGDDELTGGTGADSLSAGAGDDTITFSEGDTADGGDGDDLFVLEDLGEVENGTITITGGSGDETDGDTLQLGDLVDDLASQRDTFTEDPAGGSFSGSITLADGTILNFSEIENIICFTPGTRIATPNGLVAIEDLKIGDLVVTRDQGLQPIRWFESRTVPAVDRFAPVRIRKNVLAGQDRDLIVSPQHRVLFQGYQAELLFGEREVLVSAKHLIDGMDVTQDEQSTVTYIHIMFDSHQVIYAEGAATESFHPGDIGMTAVSDQAREELFAIFPELRADQSAYGNTARRCLKAHEAKLIKS